MTWIIGLFAHPLFAFAGANLKRDIGAVWAWLCHRSFWQLVSLGLALFCGWQYVQINGVKVWPIHIVGLHTQFENQKRATASVQRAFNKTVADYRTAAAKQKADEDAKNARTAARQAQISKEQSDEYESRIAAARAEYRRLLANAKAGADPGSVPGAPVSGVPVTTSSPAEASCENGLSDALTATCQAIQLDELIKWARAQHAVDPNK